MKLYWARDMREVDRISIEEMGVPSLTLMENAATAVTQALLELVPELLAGSVTVLCGRGNNGGDGMAVARLLRGKGYEPQVLLAAEPSSLSGDAAAQLGRLRSSGVPFTVVSTPDSMPATAARLCDSDLVIDALLGTGLSGPARGYQAEIIKAVNDSGAFIAAVDIPSGLSGDALGPSGETVEADLTLTLALAKPCLYTPEGAPFCGEVVVLDIGEPREAVRRISPVAELLDEAWATPFFTERPPDAHKGHIGRVLIVAGSRGKSGAAVLAARGALRAGSGLVTVGVPASMQPVVAASLPEAMTLPLPETSEGTLSMDALTPILGVCSDVDAVGLGPGIGSFPETAALCRCLYAQVLVPMAVDADGLNAFQSQAELLRHHERPRVLTPHPGEMGRILGTSAAEVLRLRYELGPQKAAEWRAALILKGYRTLVAWPGVPWRLNLSGGPHMAGPGFGDVLTGMVTALLGRRLDPFDAASLAAWWHGAAADDASARLGGYGLLASECADALPCVEGRLREPC